MSMLPDETLLIEAALEMGISESFVEKDWFVTQVIKRLAEHPFLDYVIVFTGGTCLSKAHKLIERFSEDIDFKLFTVSLDGASPSKVRKSLSKFKLHVANVLGDQFDLLQVEARDSNRHIAIDLAYPSLYEPATALRPHIKLEFTLSHLALPSIDLPVSSFVSELAGTAPEVPQIACINPVENAAEKLSALIWRVPSRVRGVGDRQPDIVRHLHDLAKLSDLVLNTSDFAALVRETVDGDATRSDVIRDLSITEKLNLMLSILETDRVYAQEYKTFVNGMSYARFGQVPSFSEALLNVKQVADRVKGQP